MKAKFKVGDVVKVKSGSPHMTISGLSTKFKSLQKESKVKIFDGIYYCTWFQDNKAFNEKFQETVLELVEREPNVVREEVQKSLTHF